LEVYEGQDHEKAIILGTRVIGVLHEKEQAGPGKGGRVGVLYGMKTSKEQKIGEGWAERGFFSRKDQSHRRYFTLSAVSWTRKEPKKKSDLKPWTGMQ